MKICFYVTIQDDASTRWFAAPREIGGKVKTLVESVCGCWSDGARPKVTIIDDQRFFKDPEACTCPSRHDHTSGHLPNCPCA